MLTTTHVAKLLGTSTDSVHKLVQRGRLKAYRTGKGSRLKFDTESVRAEWLRRLSREQGSDRGSVTAHSGREELAS